VCRAGKAYSDFLKEAFRQLLVGRCSHVAITVTAMIAAHSFTQTEVTELAAFTYQYARA